MREKRLRQDGIRLELPRRKKKKMRQESPHRLVRCVCSGKASGCKRFYSRRKRLRAGVAVGAGESRNQPGSAPQPSGAELRNEANKYSVFNKWKLSGQFAVAKCCYCAPGSSLLRKVKCSSQTSLPRQEEIVSSAHRANERRPIARTTYRHLPCTLLLFHHA